MKNVTVNLSQDEWESVALIAENESLPLKEAAASMIRLGIEVFVKEEKAYQPLDIDNS